MCVLQKPLFGESSWKGLWCLQASSSQRKVVVWLSFKLQPLSPALKD